MADPVTQAPSLDSMVRQPDGSIRFTWTNNVPSGAQTYSTIQVGMRVAGAGTYTGVNTLGYPTISNQFYTQYTKPGGGPFLPGVGYEMALRAFGPAGWSAWSNQRSVPALSTPTPTLTSVTRTGPGGSTAVIAQNPAPPATVDAVYLYTRRPGTSTWTQRNRTTSPSQTEVSVPLPEGNHAYEVVARSSGPAGWSEYSAIRTVAAWWQTPANPSITGAERDPATGAVTLTWEGSPTEQAPWVSIEIWRAVGATGQFSRVTTLPGSRRTYTGAADPTRLYRYRVVVKSHAGDSQATTGNLGPTTLVPNAPSNVNAVYETSGAANRATVTWTRNPTGERPYTSQRVGRRPYGSDAAWTWSTVTSTATTSTISVGANLRLEFTVDAGNAAGRSEEAVPSGPVVTTPARPASLTAAWSGTNILLDIPAYSTVGDRLVLEFSTDNALWFPAAFLPVSARSWLHESPTPALPHWYRAWVESDAVGTPDSTVVTSAPAPALTKPAPPTILPLTILAATEAIPVGIVHNPLDGTAQTMGEIQHRVGVGAWATISLGALDTGWIPSATYSNGAALQLQARTQGAAGIWSDWSPVTTTTLRARPTGAITAPGATVEGQQVTTTWTASAQVSALVELLDAASGVVEAVEVGSAARSATFAAVLADQSDYSIRLTIRDAYQASLPILRAFTVELDRPDVPLLSATFAQSSATVATSVVVDADTVRVELYRDGILIGEAIPDGLTASLADPLPPQKAVTYTVRAYSAVGGWSQSAPVEVWAATRDVLLNYGPGWGGMVRGGKVERTGSGGGRLVDLREETGHGVTAYRSEDRAPIGVSAAVQLLPATGASSVQEWIDALAHDGPVAYREPGGRTIIGAAELGSWSDGTRYRAEISFAVVTEAL